MINYKQFCCGLAAAILTTVILSSCNNSHDTVSAGNEVIYSQPVVVPLQFTTQKPLRWDTVKTGGINAAIKNIAIDQLPAVPFDSNGFKAFSKAPEELSLNISVLPEATCNLDSLRVTPIKFKTSVLLPPALVKVGSPQPQHDNPITILDFGQAQGQKGKFISCLLKDKHGLLWIASSEGLFRYDGEHMQTFIPGPRDVFIAGMAEDNNGNIWYIQQNGIGMINPVTGRHGFSGKIGCVKNNLAPMYKDSRGFIWVSNNVDKGVSIIDPATQTFKNLDRSKGLSDSMAYEMLEDRDKNIWITTATGGANIINPATHKIKYLKTANGLGSDSLTAITQDQSGKVWLSEKGAGLDAIDIKRGTIKHYSELQGLETRYCLNATFDLSGRLWIGTSQGIEVIDPEKNTIRHLSLQNGLSGNTVAACIADDHKRMWIGTTLGLNIILNDAETTRPLGNTVVITMMEDTAENLWIGTTQGISIISPEKHLLRTLNKSNGLTNEFIQSFTKSDGQVYVATNGGLDIIDLSKKTSEHIGRKQGLTSDTTYAVFKDKQANIWLSGPVNGIDMIDSAKKMIRHTGVSGGLSENNVQDIKQDNNGNLWIATAASGVNVIDLANNTVKYLNNQPGLRDTCNRMLLLDKNGRMWIGTDKGIYVADIKQQTLTAITTGNGLSGNRVRSLLEYKGSVVAGTTTGLNIITAPGNIAVADEAGTGQKAWEITKLDKAEGLIRLQSSSWNTDLITKKGRYLWGDRGVIVIDEIKSNNDSFATYVTGINIMTQPQYFVNRSELAENDTLWNDNSFYVKGKSPENTGYSTTKDAGWDSVAGPYNMPVNLHIPHYSNYLQFHFAQVHLGRQDTTWYSYLLEGIDKNWSTPGINPFTENYLSVPPGKYIFKVKSKDINGKWGEPAIFSFIISPPWYNTWWAYSFFALASVILLRAYIVYRSHKLKNENRLLEEKVTLRTNQLQQSLEELKTTQRQLIQSEKMASLGELTAGIAHEIQNPLNFVNNFSEINTELIQEMQEEIDKGNLEDAKAIANDISANEQKINQHGKRADAIVKGMLQHSRSNSGLKELTNINALADEYFRLAYHGLRAKDKLFNATMQTDYDENIGTVNIIRQDIGRVILNLITNSFYAVTEKKKQAGEGYHPTVKVSTKQIKGNEADGRRTIEIRVLDNGNGIPQKVLDKIFQPFFTTKPTGQGTGLGLSMSYDIITKGHGGELKVLTTEGEGAEFIITLPV